MALLLCSAFGVQAQQKDKQYYKQSTTVSPSFNLGSQRTDLNFGKRKKAIPEPLPPLPQTVADFHNLGSPMPRIRLVAAKGVIFTDSMLKNDANIFVMMFHPTCEHCEDMTRVLEANIALFKSSHIVLMAAPMMGPYMDFFEKNTRHAQYPKLMVGLDSAGFVDRTFNYVALPQINIYDKERKLIKTFSGLGAIDSLRPYIQ